MGKTNPNPTAMASSSYSGVPPWLHPSQDSKENEKNGKEMTRNNKVEEKEDGELNSDASSDSVPPWLQQDDRKVKAVENKKGKTVLGDFVELRPAPQKEDGNIAREKRESLVQHKKQKLCSHDN